MLLAVILGADILTHDFKCVRAARDYSEML